MLDKWLEVSYGKTKEAEAKDRRIQLMRNLPNDMLLKIANGHEKLGMSGEIAKSAYCGEDGKWLDRFKGTPLFAQALEIERGDLENRMAEKQRRQERRSFYEAEDAARDDLDIKRKLLELQLAEHEAGGGGVPGEEPMVQGAEAAAEEPTAAAAGAAPETADPQPEAPPAPAAEPVAKEAARNIPPASEHVKRQALIEADAPPKCNINSDAQSRYDRLSSRPSYCAGRGRYLGDDSWCIGWRCIGSWPGHQDFEEVTTNAHDAGSGERDKRPQRAR
jgi:hypothetical protein